MAKKACQRISYVLPLAGSQAGGHRLGVNGLAVDRDGAILYSGGRDGIVCAWDLNLDLRASASSSSVRDTTPPSDGGGGGGGGGDGDGAPNGAAAKPKPKPRTTFRTQTQAHTHWINDIVLAQGNSALVSCSSDLTVKVWRPHTDGDREPAAIGQHADYVKCVATPAHQQSNWVASGGLDRKIYLWDLNGGGKTLEVDVSGEEITEKGSVYALSVNDSILASGGPESIVRLWDPKSGKRISKFVGHTDNIRAILVNQAGDTVMTASSDQTVKVWSVTAGRCIHTLTMHSDSVWSLYSDDPDLGIFYSSDRSGLVVKTDVRGTLGEMDDGLSLAVAQEHEGVGKVVACGDYIWTATSTSSINRWPDVDTGADIQLPEALQQGRPPASVTRSGSVPTVDAASGPPPKKEIPAASVLRISNTAVFPSRFFRDSEAATVNGVAVSRKGSEIVPEPQPAAPVEPIHRLPEETIEGQFGLVKHRLLNDRRRVLTLDTAGDVLLWDLIQCEPIQSFGKKHLEDVEPLVNTLEAVAPWCSIDTSSGNLTVVLEPFNCFDAEMYADELVLDEPIEFREDQRINLGKWILRYLFANLIDEEIKRDEAHRKELDKGVEKRLAAARANPPAPISLPPPISDWEQAAGSPVTTPRGNAQFPPPTPGIGIGLATPSLGLNSVREEPASPASHLGRKTSQISRPSVDKEDYFSNAIGSVEVPGSAKPAATPAEPAGAGAAADDKGAKAPADAGKDKDRADSAKSPSTPFGKKFRMGMSFGSKKLGRSASTTAPEKPAVVDEKAEESESSSNHEKEFDDCFLGVVQRIRDEYEKQLAEAPDKFVESRVTPSLPGETPVLKLPPGMKVFIQEETSGGSAELYRGTVESVGADADVVEKCGPMWLGEVLLQNTIPPKDPVKVSFVLHPWQDALPSIAAADGNYRLNANRMLRVKKILAYVAERIEPEPEEGEEEDPDALRPDEYLELYCNDQLLPINMSLATLRAHIWKGGNDIVLYYKANGKKEIKLRPPPPPPPPPSEPSPESETEPAANHPAGQAVPVGA